MQLIKIYLIFSVLLLALSAKVSAQTQLSGTVRDAKNNELMVGASIYIRELQDGVITNDDGKYSFTIPYGKYTMEFSFIGYETIKKQINCNKERLVINTSLHESALKLDAVVVIAKSEARQIREQAMPISVITMRELQGTVSDVSDVLSKISGVKIRSSGGVGSSSRISVRGLEGKRIGFYVNGAPLSNNNDFVNVNDIPVDLIERIEIYKGIVPAKFGGSAMGGAVNIETKEYPPKYLDASYTLQSFNTHKITGVIKRNKNGIVLGIGGFYTYSDNDYTMELPLSPKGRFKKRNHDQFKKLIIGATFKSTKWWFDEVNFEPAIISSEKEIQGIEYNIQEAKSSSDSYVFVNHDKKSNFLIEGLDMEADFAYVYTINRFQDKSKYKYEWNGDTLSPSMNDEGIGLGEIGSVPNDAYNQKHTFFQKLNLNYVLNSKNSFNLNSLYNFAKGMPQDTLKDLINGYKTNFNSTMNNWTLGFAYEFNTANKKFTNMLNGKYYYYAMQTQLVNINSSDHIPEDIDNHKSDFGISNAMRFRFTPAFLIKTSIAYDVRLPSDNELLGDGFLITPAGDLSPERNTSFNLGLMYDITNGNQKRFQLETNIFYMYLENMIRFTGGPLQSVYENFGEMRTLGAEIEVKWDATRWLYLWGNVTYQDLRDTREHKAGSTAPNTNKGDRMPNIPYLFANGGIELHRENVFGGTGQNTRLFSDCAFVEEYFYDFEESKRQQKRVPRSFTINAGLEHSLRNQSIFFSVQVNNLTDAKVMSEFNRPLPGRNWGVKMRYVWK